ncbi:MAG: hypothetical protein PHX18_04475 [Candidatus Gastranaerophilales bacterium]|nr:hypothetical protein [Candidatus Gastranaerophilales bacterium]
MFKKIFIFVILFAIIYFAFASGSYAKVRKVKCKTPIYFFTEVTKHDFFGIIDEYLQSKEAKVTKFYPEIGFIYVQKTNGKEPQFAAINMKQFGNDVYMFVNEDKDKRDFQEKMYKVIRYKNDANYRIVDNYFCEEFKKDTNSILNKKKILLQDDIYNPFVYTISVKRYVGYKKSKNSKDKKEKQDKKEKL